MNTTEDLLKEYYGENVKVEREVIPADQRITRLQQLVQSDDSPDLFTYDNLPSLTIKGYVQCAEDYINFDTPLWSGLTDYLRSNQIGGKISLVQCWSGTTQVVWYNKDLFAEAGLKNPKELLDEGNWNWNTFLSTANALTIGSGEDISQYGAAIEAEDMIVASTGKHFISFDNGQPKNNMLGEEISRAMTFWGKMFTENEGIFPGASGRQLFTQGMIAMLGGFLWHRTVFSEMLAEGTVAFVPMPKDPSTEDYYIVKELGGYYIPKGAKNPAGAAAMLCADRYAQLDPQRKKENFDYMAQSFNWNQECEDMVDYMSSDAFVGVPSTWIAFDLGAEELGTIYARPKEGEPWATIAEEISPIIDSKISTVMNGANEE